MTSSSTRRRALRRAAVPLAAIAVAVGVAAATATPAAASNSYTGNAYVYGAGDATDDFNDEGAVNVNTNSQSNVTCLWQMILWEDGLLPKSGIDGSFGTNTYNATVAWQKKNKLTADGSAGKLTWKKAATHMSFARMTSPSHWQANYVGKNGYFDMYRNLDKGNWEFRAPNGFQWASYNSNTC